MDIVQNLINAGFEKRQATAIATAIDSRDDSAQSRKDAEGIHDRLDKHEERLKAIDEAVVESKFSNRIIVAMMIGVYTAAFVNFLTK